MPLCPCNSGKNAGACCGPILAGKKPALTAEALMRARYSAHALGNYAYLESSLHSSRRESVDASKLRQWSEAVTWKGLEILSTEGGGKNDESGAISFVARYEVNGVPHELREDAAFAREDGQWRYVDGNVHGHTPYKRAAPKIGRNEPCPCGSGKKYKKCCEGVSA